MKKIELWPGVDVRSYLPELDPREADRDFLCAVTEGEESVRVLAHDGEAVGLADALPGRRAWLYLYIFPPFRGLGYGTAAGHTLEGELAGAEKVTTCFRSGDTAAERFAEKLGYRRQYASDYMVYQGPPFGERGAGVRPYRDEDYAGAFDLYARAFHLMRLSTGCFPDSRPEQPDEKMRARWADTAGERLVCELDGEVVGYAHVEGDQLGSVAVKPECQGRGIGRKLVRASVDRILAAGYGQAGLYCVAGNPARALYERLGFERVYRNDYVAKK